MPTNPFENAELARAERKVARLPRRNLLSPRRPATRLGKVWAAVAPLAAIATVVIELKFSYAPTSDTSVWVALVALAIVTVVISLAAGELGGRWGRVSGIVSGVLIVPPIGMVLATWLIELFKLAA